MRLGACAGLGLLLLGAAGRAPSFTDISVASGTQGSWAACGVGAADIDNDGDLDLCTSAVNGGSSRVYRNNGNGTFSDVANSGTGGESQTCVLGDIQNDGFPDLYLGFYWSSSRMFSGTGGAVPFTDVTGASGTGVSQTWTGNAFADVDGDGDLDLFVARAGGNRLFINNGSGAFSNQAAARGVEDGSVGCHAVAFGDVDGDGDQDFFLGRDLGNVPRLYLNNGSGVFTDGAAAAGLTGATSGRAAVFGDIDNDGDLDLFVAKWGNSFLFVNNGSGTFADISVPSGTSGLEGAFGCAFGDYDNDGDLDLFIAQGEIGGGAYVNMLFRNDGGNVFTEVAAAEGVQGPVTEHRGAIFLDIENDGDLDLFMSSGDPTSGYRNAMYRNDIGGTAYLKVRAVGSASNRTGVGTRLWIYEAGHLGEAAFLRGFREVSAGSGQASCPPAEQHFGLGALTSVDLRVRFPSGIVVDQTSVAAGQILTVVEPSVPFVTLVSSTAANGAYGVGMTIPVTVTFNQPVVVTGTPRLTLETGTPDALVDYAGGSGSSTLTFSYTVASGHAAADLDYVSTTSLALNGGTIKNSFGTDALLTLPAPGAAGSLGGNKNIVVDTVPRSVTNITSTSPNGSYGIGATIPVLLTFTQTVFVTGSPRLTLETGPADGEAVYASGSGTATLAFSYAVAAGHQSPDLDCVSSSALALNGGSIKDAFGQNAALTLPTPGGPGSLGANKALIVDGLAPTVTSITSPNVPGVYSPGSTLTVTVIFSEPVSVTGTPSLQLETGSSDVWANYAGGSGSNLVAFQFTVQTGHSSPDLDVVSSASLLLNGGTISDAVGNPAALNLPAPGTAGSLSANTDLRLVDPRRDIVLDGKGCGTTGLEGFLILLPWLVLRRRRIARAAALVLLAALASSAPAAFAQEEPKETVDKPAETEAGEVRADAPVFVHALRFGAWFIPEFDAITPSGRRKFAADSLFDVGLDAGAEWDSLRIFLTADLASSGDVTLLAGGVHAGTASAVGWEALEPAQLYARLSAGILGGTLKADEANFGDFSAAVGFQARAALTLLLPSRLEAGLWFDYRFLSFDFDESVSGGDEEAVGGSFAVGLAFSVGF